MGYTTRIDNNRNRLGLLRHDEVEAVGRGGDLCDRRPAIEMDTVNSKFSGVVARSYFVDREQHTRRELSTFQVVGALVIEW